MAKNVKRIILSEKQPNNKHIAWAKPEEDNIDLKVFEDNKWKSVISSGCIDVIVKGIVNSTTNETNYTVEKGNFEEVYNGILSGKMYSFNIYTFIPSQSLEENIVQYGIFSQQSNYNISVNSEEPSILITEGQNRYIWTSEHFLKDAGIQYPT